MYLKMYYNLHIVSGPHKDLQNKEQRKVKVCSKHEIRESEFVLKTTIS